MGFSQALLGPPFPVYLAGLLFFSTYTLLVLFWAEIYYQARSLPTGSLRPAFVVMNTAVYAIQVGGCWGVAGAAAPHSRCNNQCWYGKQAA